MFTESFDGNSWKEPLEVSGPTCCSKQAKLERVVQSRFEYVQERRFCNISGPLYQYLTTLIVSKFFQIPNGGIAHAATCIVMSHPFSGQLQDAFSSICLKPAIRQLKTRVMSSLSLLFLHLIKPTSLSCSYSQLQDYKKPCNHGLGDLGFIQAQFTLVPNLCESVQSGDFRICVFLLCSILFGLWFHFFVLRDT